MRSTHPRNDVLRLLCGLLLLLTAFGCAEDSAEGDDADAGLQDYIANGKSDTAEQLVDGQASMFRVGNRNGGATGDEFFDTIQPLIAQRCTVCHGCADAPCQLKLTSYEGIRRGASPLSMFKPRVTRVSPSNLHDGRVVDEHGFVDFDATEAVWRSKGFYPVASHGKDAAMTAAITRAFTNWELEDLEDEWDLYKSGAKGNDWECLGEKHTGPDGPSEKMLKARGMPFGLQPLAPKQYGLLAYWLYRGAPEPSKTARAALAAPSDPRTIAVWEDFLNGDSAQEQLAARYIYEHTFFAHIVFPENDGEFFEMVRSHTPPGTPIDPVSSKTIVTEHDAQRIYYRLKKVTAVIVQKQHMTWRFDDKLLERWDALFMQTDWGQNIVLPGYGETNPFVVFEQIPSRIRSRFMLESAYHLIDAMVRGDVCTGSSATYAIRDRFWVWFYNPGSDTYPAPGAPLPEGFDAGSDPSAIDPNLGLATLDHLTPVPVIVENETAHMTAFETQMRALHPDGMGLDDIWYGDGFDPNAFLTVLRHGESASVHYGGIAGLPDTIWMLSYGNFERLYYTLVVDFKLWGTVSDKLSTWEMMSYVRSGSEQQFLTLLPEGLRDELREEWLGWFPRASQKAFDLEDYPTKVEHRPNIWAMLDVAQQVTERMAPDAYGPDDHLNPYDVPAAAGSRLGGSHHAELVLSTLTGGDGEHARYLPDATVLRILDENGEPQWVYSLITNRGYDAHNRTLLQALARSTERDTVSLARGVVSNYPQMFIDIPLAEAQTFVNELKDISSKSSWRKFIDRNSAPDTASGIRVILRQSEAFWPFVDWLHKWNFAYNGAHAGVLDLSQYFWREGQ